MNGPSPPAPPLVRVAPWFAWATTVAFLCTEAIGLGRLTALCGPSGGLAASFAVLVPDAISGNPARLAFFLSAVVLLGAFGALALERRRAKRRLALGVLLALVALAAGLSYALSVPDPFTARQTCRL
ncbi:MAG: hypothetical protein ACREM2_10270 [Vulcanimicrobiaceae bacterium]